MATKKQASVHKYPDAQSLAKEAIRRLKLRLTDEVFLIIQNDRELMADYLNLVGEGAGDNGWTKINKAIGAEVKKAFSGVSNKSRTGAPETFLARSYTEFE